MSEITKQNTYTKSQKRRFDREYATQFFLEVQYLKAHKIYPSFVRTDHDITTWKFTRTSELFSALTDFYKERENERSLRKAEEESEAGKQLTLDDLQHMHIFGVLPQEYACDSGRDAE